MTTDKVLMFHFSKYNSMHRMNGARQSSTHCDKVSINLSTSIYNNVNTI